MTEHLDEIRRALDEFDVDRARALIRDQLKSNPSADLYYYASQVALSEEQKREFLQKAIDLDPFHAEADAALGDLRRDAPSDQVDNRASDYADYFETEEKLKRDQFYDHAAGRADGMTQYELATIGSRFGASFIDGIILTVIWIVVAVVITLVSPPPDESDYLFGEFSPEYEDANARYGLLLLGGFLVVSVGYHVLFLTTNDGQTPGKTALRIRIVKLNGAKLSLTDAFLRNVIGYWLSQLFFLLGYLWAIWDDKSQTWHDKLAGTVVVKAG